MATPPHSINRVHRSKKWLIFIGTGLTVLLALTVLASVLSGYGFNIRAFGSAALNVVRAIGNHSTVVANTGNFRNVIFLHHSVGHNLIEQGSVRELFTRAGYQFWDHDYNSPGLTDPTGNPLGYSYSVPADNTDPDGLLQIFSQPVYGLPLNTLSSLLQHEVIVFKSCYPASNITSDAQLDERKTWYLKMRGVMDRYGDRVFIVITQPPLNPAETNPEAAKRARAFAEWLKSDEYADGRLNVFTFDLFGRLAEDDPTAPDFNMLRADYREGTDSHPTAIANQLIGPQLVEFVTQSVEQFKAAR